MNLKKFNGMAFKLVKQIKQSNDLNQLVDKIAMQDWVVNIGLLLKKKFECTSCFMLHRMADGECRGL